MTAEQTPHPEAHEDRLIELCSAADARAAFARSDLRGCARCHDLLDDYLLLGDALDATGRDVAETEAEAAQWQGAPGEDQVESVLRAQIPATPVSLWRPLVAIAATLLIGVFLANHWWPGEEDREDPPPIHLGGSDRAAVSPVGEVGEYGRFEWQGPLPKNGWYDLRIVGPDGEVLVAEEGLDDPGFGPIPDSRDWPATIHWEVAFFHASGAWIETVTADVRRRP